MKRFVAFLTVVGMILMLPGVPAGILAAETVYSGTRSAEGRAGSEIAIDETNFPDANFRQYVSDELDDDNNGSLSESERMESFIFVNGKNIADLTGIEYFTELVTLYCSNNQLTALDVSSNTKLSNFQCDNNQLTSLDVSKCTALTSFICRYNRLTALDLSKCTALSYISCEKNQLTSLTLGANTVLTGLQCADNRLTELDLSGITGLEECNCSYNQLQQLDVSSNTALKVLDCSGNLLEKLDLSSNTAIEKLYCSYNRLAELNIRNCTEITELNSNNNKLNTIDFSNNTKLGSVELNDNQLQQLDVSRNTALKCLRCFGNQLKVLDLSNNSELEILDCRENQLSSLDLTSTKVTSDNVQCAQNQATISACLFAPSDLPGNFDLSRAKNMTECKLTDDNKILYLGGTSVIQYDYDLGNGKSELFNLKCDPAHSCTKVEAVDETCTADGNIEYYVCSACGYKFSKESPAAETDLLKDDDIVIDATGHEWGDWRIATDPTLTEEGTAERVCAKNSAHKETKVLPVLTDTTVWMKDDTRHVEPTEEEDGMDTYISEYGDVEVVLPAKGHTHEWGDWTIATEPTLTEGGTAERVCAKNNAHKETKVLPVLTDTTVWTKDDSQHVEPTEEEEGKDVYTSEYGDVEVVLPAKGHTHEWGDWTIATEPTLTEGGTAERVCAKNNAHKETKVLPVLTDTTVWTKDDSQHVEPTEEEEGKDVYTSEYGDVEVVLPAKGNTGGDAGDVVENVKDTAGTNAELVLDNTLIENTLTIEDKKEMEEGHSFEIALEITDIRESVSADDVTAVLAALGSDEKIGIYVDLSLIKIKDQTERTLIHNTDDMIGIVLTIPDNIYTDDRTYSIIRVHDGTAENLGGIYDKGKRTLTFYSDRFSTYAITYQKQETPVEPETPIQPVPPETSAPETVDKAPSTGSPTVTPSLPQASAATETAVSAASPKTGDRPVTGSVFLMLLSGAFLCATAVFGKRRQAGHH